MSVRAGEPFAFCRDDDGGDDVPGSFLPFFLVGGTRIPRIGSRWRVSPDVFVLLRKGQTVKMPTFGIMRCVEPPLTHALFSLGEMQPAAAPVWLFFLSRRWGVVVPEDAGAGTWYGDGLPPPGSAS